MNYRRKSTSGWSIGNVLLDFGGGLLSVAQLVFDSWRKGRIYPISESLQDNWSGIIGDPVKFFLGLLSMMFDVIFMIQHYILYKPPKADYEKLEPINSEM